MSYPINRTPAHLRCTIGACHSIHQRADGKLVVRGEFDRETGIDVAANEVSIIIDRALLGDLIQAPAATDKPSGDHLRGEIVAQLYVNTDEIIEVGKALLPYLRHDLSHEELGAASHDAAVRLARAWKARIRGIPPCQGDRTAEECPKASVEPGGLHTAPGRQEASEA